MWTYQSQFFPSSSTPSFSIVNHCLDLPRSFSYYYHFIISLASPSTRTFIAWKDGENPCPCWHHLAVEFTLKFLPNHLIFFFFLWENERIFPSFCCWSPNYPTMKSMGEETKVILPTFIVFMLSRVPGSRCIKLLCRINEWMNEKRNFFYC